MTEETGSGIRSRLPTGLDDVRSALRRTILRGRDHFERVEQTPYRVTVTGVRGKSTVVRWLNEGFVDRGHETYAKVTGNHPLSFHNRDSDEIEREGMTRLYENAREFETYGPVDAAVVENQGIREYTTRLANEFFDPHVVVLANVRRDHQSTLGEHIEDIARVFTRVMPEETVVVSGDRNDAINDYLRREFSRTGHEFRVAAPEEAARTPFADVLGARTAFVVDETLRTLGMDPLDPGQIQAHIDELHRAWGWQRLDGGGLVANGASLNDIESTELLRQFLVERLEDTTVTPFVYTRRDRAGRTAAFVHYLDWLAENDQLTRVHAAGTHRSLLARRVDAEVVQHDESERAGAILDATLEPDRPVYLVGNTVATFMRELTDEIDRRSIE